MVSYLLVTASLVFIPLMAMSAARLASWWQFRAALGPGVPATVPESWLEAYPGVSPSDPPAPAG